MLNEYEYRGRVWRSEAAFITLGPSRRKPWIAMTENRLGNREWRIAIPEEGSTRGYLRRFKTEEEATSWVADRARALNACVAADNRRIAEREGATVIYSGEALGG